MYDTVSADAYNDGSGDVYAPGAVSPEDLAVDNAAATVQGDAAAADPNFWMPVTPVNTTWILPTPTGPVGTVNGTRQPYCLGGGVPEYLPGNNSPVCVTPPAGQLTGAGESSAEDCSMSSYGTTIGGIGATDDCAIRAIYVNASQFAKTSASSPLGGVSSASPKRFTSPDPSVADVANAIDAEYPGEVIDTNVPAYNPDTGQMVTDFDIETQDAVIQVKTGSASGLGSQILRTEAVTGKVVIGYAPDAPPAALAAWGRQGLLVTNNLQSLIEVLAPA
jgi:hypothetical protein